MAKHSTPAKSKEFRIPKKRQSTENLNPSSMKKPRQGENRRVIDFSQKI